MKIIILKISVMTLLLIIFSAFAASCRESVKEEGASSGTAGAAGAEASAATAPSSASSPSAATPETPAPDRATSFEAVAPVTVNPVEILEYDKNTWRFRGYELFSWDLFPEILIFDFADYKLQRKFFARLAFFTGVSGESGEIEEESYYEGKHVFNAHDYSPESLADFYLTAQKKGIELNSEEKLLLDIALGSGILKLKNREITPGRGAVLSVSREIPSYLRMRLLRHEAVHGLFYLSADFRNRCFEIWNSMESDEQAYWRYFLQNKGRLDNRSGYTGYDIENHFLLVNEIAGHMLQLKRSEVNSYFMDIYLGRLEQLLPEEKHLFDKIRRRPDMFMKTRDAFENALSEVFGLAEGNLFPNSREQG